MRTKSFEKERTELSKKLASISRQLRDIRIQKVLEELHKRKKIQPILLKLESELTEARKAESILYIKIDDILETFEYFLFE